jgi:hypothetical protein
MRILRGGPKNIVAGRGKPGHLKKGENGMFFFGGNLSG